MERLGGKWVGRKVKAHVFEFDPSEMLSEVIATGAMPEKNLLAFFRTPVDVANRVVKRASLDSLQPGQAFLEPSAGDGGLLDVAKSYLD